MTIRTCNGCKALETVHIARCTLGYPVTVTKVIMGVEVGCKPSNGQCPKPRTNDMYLFYLMRKNSNE
jgi:hypothetical protein